MLREAGVQAGLEEAEVRDWLESDKGGEEVDKEVAEAQIRGVSGVPNFVLQGKYEIGGAQDAAAFVKVRTVRSTSSLFDIRLGSHTTCLRALRGFPQPPPPAFCQTLGHKTKYSSKRLLVLPDLSH